MSRKHRRGAAATEFALSLPILVLLISGVCDYGWYFGQANQVAHAVREGVRYGVTLDQGETAEGETEARTLSALEATGFECGGGCDVEAVTSSAGSTVVLAVTATVEFRPLIGLAPLPQHVSSTLSMAFQDQF